MAHALTQGIFGTDTTCDVTTQELEVLTPSVFENSLHLPVHATWIALDRSFASAIAGTLLMMLGSTWMVLTSVHEPATVAVVKAARPHGVDVFAMSAATSDSSSPKAAPAKSPAAMTKRKTHKTATKPSRKRLATRPTAAPRKGAIAVRTRTPKVRDARVVGRPDR